MVPILEGLIMFKSAESFGGSYEVCPNDNSNANKRQCDRCCGIIPVQLKSPSLVQATSLFPDKYFLNSDHCCEASVYIRHSKDEIRCKEAKLAALQKDTGLSAMSEISQNWPGWQKPVRRVMRCHLAPKKPINEPGV